MSTRAQAFIKGTKIYLYQHYDGYNLFDEVVEAIKSDNGKYTRDEDEYVARVIFDAMTSKTSPSMPKYSGFGIGNELHSDIDFLVVVDCKKKVITEKENRLDKWSIKRSYDWGKDGCDEKIP